AARHMTEPIARQKGGDLAGERESERAEDRTKNSENARIALSLRPDQRCEERCQQRRQLISHTRGHACSKHAFGKRRTSFSNKRSKCTIGSGLRTNHANFTVHHLSACGNL